METSAQKRARPTWAIPENWVSKKEQKCRANPRYSGNRQECLNILAVLSEHPTYIFQKSTVKIYLQRRYKIPIATTNQRLVTLKRLGLIQEELSNFWVSITDGGLKALKGKIDIPGKEVAKIVGLYRTPVPMGYKHLILKRDNYKCVECGATNKETMLTLDHKIPFSMSDDTECIDNYQTLCWDCNLNKRNNVWKNDKKNTISD